MKALFIGGTGTISMAISEMLLRQGWELHLLNRGNRNATLEGAKHVQGDIHDEAAVEKLIKGEKYDVVADFIAFTREHVERDIRLFKDRTKQYIFISSASAYQKPLSQLPITESTPLANPYWEYSRNKIACEDALMAEYRANGFPITIVRPSHTYDLRNISVGVHGHNGGWQVIERMKQGKPILVQGDGSSLWTFTLNEDFAPGFIGLMGNPHAIGEAVHITSDESLSWNQAYRVIAEALGVEYKPCYVPSSLLAKLGASAGYDFEGALTGDKSNTVIFDNSKIKRLVPGFTCKTRFDQGMRRALANLEAHPEYKRLDPDFDAFSDRVCALMSGIEY